MVAWKNFIHKLPEKQILLSIGNTPRTKEIPKERRCEIGESLNYFI
jgi:hypothetical protein